LPAPVSDSVIVFECCFIRHPLDRLASLYSFSLKKDVDSILGRLAARNDLKGFLLALLDRFPHMVCNPQTTLVANEGRFTRPPDAEDLDRAMHVMRKMAVPGVVNRFDDSLAVAEYFLQPAFPGLSLHYTSENVGRALDWSLGEREREFRRACGDELFGEIKRLNELDWQLFRSTEHEVRRRASLVPMFGERLAGFRARCGSPESPSQSAVA
jgi:hypothetical protein